MINVQEFDSIFSEIYGNKKEIKRNQFQRYEKLIKEYEDKFEEQDLHFFSTPGRTEIGGNHTDHNHGRVLAASVDLDSVAVAAFNNTKNVILYSEGYDKPFVVDLADLKVQGKEEGTTEALIRGIVARLEQLGYTVGGFNACMTSSVLPGSGLSSSASVEVLIGTIFNALFNDDKIESETLALICQYSENVYFGKPCGLMDQMACAVGGIITIDFIDPIHPVVKKVNFDQNEHDYSLLVVNTGGTHADLTHEYSAIPEEMKAIACTFNAEVMRDVSVKNFMKKIPQLRKKEGDRAVLRALHFLQENERVVEQVKTLEEKDFRKFLDLVKESGNSSFRWLQNIYTSTNVQEQGITLGLALTERYLDKIQAGVCRVHGGGFAGTIQVFLPNGDVDNYVKIIESVFGEKSALVLKIRSLGTIYLNALI